MLNSRSAYPLSREDCDEFGHGFEGLAALGVFTTSSGCWILPPPDGANTEVSWLEQNYSPNESHFARMSPPDLPDRVNTASIRIKAQGLE